jgi:hypothetical protein
MPPPTVRASTHPTRRLHPEIVTLRFKLLDGEMAQMNAREREIRASEKRGRAGRR